MSEIHDPHPERDIKRRNRLFGDPDKKRAAKPCQYQPFIDGTVDLQRNPAKVTKRTVNRKRRRGDDKPVLLDDDLGFQFNAPVVVPVIVAGESVEKKQGSSRRRRKKSRLSDDSRKSKTVTPNDSALSFDSKPAGSIGNMVEPVDAVKVQRRQDDEFSSSSLEEDDHVKQPADIILANPAAAQGQESPATSNPFTPPAKTRPLVEPSSASSKVEDLVCDVRFFEEPSESDLFPSAATNMGVAKSSPVRNTSSTSPVRAQVLRQSTTTLLPLTPPVKSRSPSTKPSPASCKVEALVCNIRLEEPLVSNNASPSTRQLSAADSALVGALRVASGQKEARKVNVSDAKQAPQSKPTPTVAHEEPSKQGSGMVRTVTKDAAPQLGDKLRGKEVIFVKSTRPKQAPPPPVEETNSQGSSGMTKLIQRLNKKRNRKRTKPSTTDSSSCASQSDQTALSKQSLITPKPQPVANVVTQQTSITPAHRRSPQDWMTKVVAEPTDVSSPLKGSPFQNAMRRNHGVLDRESFIQQSSLHVLPVVQGATKDVGIDEECGWRSVHHKSLAIMVSDTDAVDQLQWEAALLKFANSRQDNYMLPTPVKLAQFKNHASLTVALKDATTILGSLADVFQLQCTFGMHGTPESVVGWLVIQMAKILNALHQAGIAHNQLGLDSFLVARQGDEWSLVLVGLGAKGVVRESGDLYSHFLHDRFSMAAMVWAFLTGGGMPLSFTQTNGEIHVDNIQFITKNCYLRGVGGWDALFQVLLNPTVPSLIPKDTLRLIESIVYMGRPGDSSSAAPLAVKSFFESLMSHKEIGGNIKDSRMDFPRDLGISSDELLLRLQLEGFSESGADEFQETRSSERAVAKPKSSGDLESAAESRDYQEASVQAINTSEPDLAAPAPIAMLKVARKDRHAKRAPPPRLDKEEPVEDIDTSDIDEPEPFAICKTATKIHRAKRPSLPPSAIAVMGKRPKGVLENLQVQNRNPAPKGRKRSAKRQKSVFESLPLAPNRKAVSKGSDDSPREEIVEKRFGSRRISRRIQTKTHCGMKGCKHEYEAGGGYMWVLKIPPEDEGVYSLPNVPTDHPMHLLCLKCRPCKEIPIVHPKEILSRTDKFEIKDWDKYLYYKASKVEYDNLAQAESEERATL